MLHVDVHTQHATCRRTYTTCYMWTYIHNMLHVGVHTQHATCRRTYTTCYMWTYIHNMLHVDVHTQHATCGRTYTTCYMWTYIHNMLHVDVYTKHTYFYHSGHIPISCLHSLANPLTVSLQGLITVLVCKLRIRCELRTTVH